MSPAAKAVARRDLRGRRDAFVAGLGETRVAREEAIAVRIAPHLPGRALIAGYVAIGAEAGVASILLEAARLGIATALPHVAARDAAMRFLRWRPSDPLVDGPFGVLQPVATAAPAKPDLILAPLVGFDRGGGRLGQGAGFYDRVFAADPAARRIGIAWSVQEMPALPLDAWDAPLHAIATEREWIETSHGRAGASPSASSSSWR